MLIFGLVSRRQTYHSVRSKRSMNEYNPTHIYFRCSCLQAIEALPNEKREISKRISRQPAKNISQVAPVMWDPTQPFPYRFDKVAAHVNSFSRDNIRLDSRSHFVGRNSHLEILSSYSPAIVYNTVICFYQIIFSEGPPYHRTVLVVSIMMLIKSSLLVGYRYFVKRVVLICLYINHSGKIDSDDFYYPLIGPSHLQHTRSRCRS